MVSEIEFSSNDIRAIIKAHNLILKKRLGQNFLIDPHILKAIVDRAEIERETTVLEIGAGVGSLTYYLAQAAKRVIAVELDRRFIPVLEQQFRDSESVKIIQGDILQMSVAQLVVSPAYFVVANIPYYISSALIRHLLEQPVKPARLVLTIQREVAERICAAPGEMSLLSLSVQVYGVPQLLMRVPASEFHPQPKVDSGVVRVDIHDTPLLPDENLKLFFMLAKAGFGQKRKTLRNALSAGLHRSTQLIVELLTACEIDPQRRAETLSLDEWIRLTNRYVSLIASGLDR